MDIVAYEQSMGGISLSDDKAALLKKLPLEEQKKQFKIVVEEMAWDNIYGERDSKPTKFSLVDVESCKYALKWVVKDGIIVGVLFASHYKKIDFRSLDWYCTAFYEHIPNGIGGSYIMVDCTLVWNM